MAASYFTVDALGHYADGMTVPRREAAALLPADTPADIAAAASELLPGGVSQHGRVSLLDPPSDADGQWVGYAELILELTRRAQHPQRPSRLEALFAFTTLDDARAFAAAYRRPGCAIHAVDGAADAFRGDARLTGLAQTPLVSAVYARWYWEGRPNPLEPPLWEVLLPLPVTIGPRVA